MKSLSSSTLNGGLTEPEASFLVQSDEDLLNLLNVYCCVNSHNDSDYIEQISSGVGFSKSGDLLANSNGRLSADELAEASSKRPALRDRVEIQFDSSSSESEVDDEKPFCFLDEEEESSLERDLEAEEMEADSEMDGEEPYDEFSEEDVDNDSPSF